MRSHSARYASPAAAVGRTERPARSVSSTPSSRSSAATAAETDGCVTYSSAAAAVTDPCRTTARKALSWVRVTAMGSVATLREGYAVGEPAVQRTGTPPTEWSGSV